MTIESVLMTSIAVNGSTEVRIKTDVSYLNTVTPKASLGHLLSPIPVLRLFLEQSNTNCLLPKNTSPKLNVTRKKKTS